jgi:hypothetical protein
MGKSLKEINHLRLYVEDFYRKELKTAKIKNNTIQFISSIRGYFKHSIRLTDIKRLDFVSTDYLIWETLLTRIKASDDFVVSGGLYFKYSDYEDLCCESSFYASKKKFINLKLLLPTPFRSYYILNPEYVIKVYVKDAVSPIEKDKQ